jgi:hypothetical protein
MLCGVLWRLWSVLSSHCYAVSPAAPEAEQREGKKREKRKETADEVNELRHAVPHLAVCLAARVQGLHELACQQQPHQAPHQVGLGVPEPQLKEALEHLQAAAIAPQQSASWRVQNHLQPPVGGGMETVS